MAARTAWTGRRSGSMGAGMTAWVWVGGVTLSWVCRCGCWCGCGCGARKLCRVARRVARRGARARARDHAGVRATECERELRDSTARLSHCAHSREGEHTRISTLSILAVFTRPRSAGVRGEGTWQGRSDLVKNGFVEGENCAPLQVEVEPADNLTD